MDTLNRGRDDFAPFAMYFDDPALGEMPTVGVDTSFFPMNDGTRTVFKIKMAHWTPNAGGPFGLINVPPVSDSGVPGLHKVEITLNFEPSRRLRLYQFDPMHHDVAVSSNSLRSRRNRQNMKAGFLAKYPPHEEGNVEILLNLP